MSMSCDEMAPALVPPEEFEAHMARVHERAAMHRANDQALRTRVSKTIKPVFALRETLARAAVDARSPTDKVLWLRAEADLLADAAEPLTPCRAGCSACCHMATAISRVEAQVIAHETGRTLAQPDPARLLTAADFVENADLDEAEFRRHKQAMRQRLMDAYTGVRCTFLGHDERCTIYAHRPVVCRTHLSLDVDNLMCRVPVEHFDEAKAIPSLYLDVANEQRLYVTALIEGLEIADIRDWFPPESR